MSSPYSFMGTDNKGDVLIRNATLVSSPQTKLIPWLESDQNPINNVTPVVTIYSNINNNILKISGSTISGIDTISTLSTLTINGNTTITGNETVAGNMTVTGNMRVLGIATLFNPITQAHANTATPILVGNAATLTALQVATGYIICPNNAGVVFTLTLPRGDALGPLLVATRGTVFDLFIDNFNGGAVATIAVGVDGILSAGATLAASAVAFGSLVIATGGSGLARFTLMFTSPVAYVFSRTA